VNFRQTIARVLAFWHLDFVIWWNFQDLRLAFYQMFVYFSRMPHRPGNNPLLQWARHGFFFIALLATLIVTSSLHAQPGVRTAEAQRAADRIELHQALLDLTNAWTVMCIAAHPDDEDGATLTVLRRKYGVHTVTLFSTFGEGGQNAVGPELYEELGAIRAQETLKAAEIQGSEPYFLGLKDFGFSKSADEAFRFWGHDEALRRMVFQIRRLRPDVIITNHDTTSGHGHHQATGRLALEAFDAAANPKRFPEQLTEVGLWQPQRLFVRFGGQPGSDRKAVEEDTQLANVITIDRNELDPLRGFTFAEEALDALRQHATQGPWPVSVPRDGWPPNRYRLVREALKAAPLPIHAVTFLDGLSLPSELVAHMALLKLDGKPLVQFVDDQERVLDALIAARKQKIFDTKRTANNARVILMRQRLNTACQLASGVSIVVLSQKSTLIPGEYSSITVVASNRSNEEVRIRSGIIGDKKAGRAGPINLSLPARLSPGSSVAAEAKIKAPANSRLNVPHHMHLTDDLWRGEVYVATLVIERNGVAFQIQDTIRLDVTPAVEIINLAPSPYVFSRENLSQPLTFKVRLVNHRDTPFKGHFGVASKITRIDRTGDDIALEANETRDFTIRTNVIPVGNPPNRSDFDSIIVSVRPSQGASVITEREARVVYIDAGVARNLRVGYVRSFDDTIRDSLSALGVESQELSIDDVRRGDLKKFNTIIMDNRGYQAHPELIALNSRLLDFARNGGTLIVFYHKPNEWNEDATKNRPNLAPFPIVLGDERVTNENAPVTFTEPDHLLLNAPNNITAQDFAGWIQERGLYYPKTWDPRYQTLFTMSDKGAEPLSGGLLVTDYGKGHYVYTSMVWYRQLRAGVPGGYRMFANMISYGHRRVVSGIF